MKFNPDSVRPDDPDARRDSASNPPLTIAKVAAVIAARVDLKPPCTFTDRVLRFLDRRAG